MGRPSGFHENQNRYEKHQNEERFQQGRKEPRNIDLHPRKFLSGAVLRARGT
jgi:hypothetical protein